MSAMDSFESRPFKPSADRPSQPEPTIVYTTEIREPGTVAAWWVSGLVLIVAILAGAFIVTRNPDTDKQVIQASAQRRLQGAVESARPPVDSSPNAEQTASDGVTGAATLTPPARLSDPTSVKTAGLVSSDSSDAR